jgi:hypothetical protein
MPSSRITDLGASANSGISTFMGIHSRTQIQKPGVGNIGQKVRKQNEFD